MQPLSVAQNELMEFSESVASRIPLDRPDLHAAWSTYSNEAVWGRQYLDRELRQLPDGSTILEVGAGVLALSGQLAREGFAVTALEPVGIGFEVIESLGRIVVDSFRESGVSFDHIPGRAEDLSDSNKYDFAFSINVLEHVDDVEGVLDRVAEALRPGARFRFRCPNYDFPYESHFGWIVPPRKALAERFCSARVADSGGADAQGLWDSLNWVNARQILEWAKTRTDAEVRLNPDALFDIWERAKADPALMARHAGPLTRAVSFADGLGAAELLRVVPTTVQPVIDGLIVKSA